MKTKEEINKQIIFVLLEIVILTAIILVSGGYAFGYVNPSISKSQVIEEKTDNKLNLAYSDLESIDNTNIMPGWSSSKEFSVENLGSSDLVYSLAWETVENNFVNKADLRYTITDNLGNVLVDNKTYPETGENISINEISDIELSSGKTNVYTLTITYRNAPYNQNADMGKSFNGKLKVNGRTK